MGTRIAVVIPCRDDAEMLVACLDALARQQRRADRIIVVDNARSDDSAAVARAAGGEVLVGRVGGIGPGAAPRPDAAPTVCARVGRGAA